MTKEQLQEIGIIYVGTKLFPHRFYISHVGEVNLREPYRMEDIYEKIYTAGYDNGVIEGEENKVNEIKRILNII